MTRNTIIAAALVALALFASTAIGGTPAPDPAPQADTCKGFRWGDGGSGNGKCWTKTQGRAFAAWLASRGASPKLFRQRHPELAAVFTQPWPPVKPRPDWQALDRSFTRAVAYSADRFGVSRSWMTACAASEGGTNPGHIAIGSSGEHGWWQYLPGTFDFMSRSAFTFRGHPPYRYRHRDSLLGQAWTTAWAFSRGLSYHWYGSGC